MRKTKEILRLKEALGLSHREVAGSLGISAGTVGKTMARALAAGLAWSEAEALTEEAIEARLFGTVAGPSRPLPDFAAVHAEYQRSGVTLQLLFEEYRVLFPAGYGYTQFCDYYNRWLGTRGLTLRQVHVAGAKAFVDWSGNRPFVIDPATGEAVPCELFVAVLGASNYTFACATRTQQIPDWISCHVRALAFFGGVPRALVPDQLKSGVSRSCRYEPEVQRAYADLARHYGTVIIPARPMKPRDKAKVESGVLVVQRWILARLRNQRFFSLAELNARIAELVADLNLRLMRKYGTTRRALLDSVERTALQPLPAEPFELATWKRAKVHVDYHIEVDRHYYSVPFRLVGEEVEVRATASTIEVFRRGERVASHPRSALAGRHTTDPAHMPKSHQAHSQWSPERLVAWGRTVGPETGRLVEAILADRPHPEQGYRSCLGILRLGKRYTPDRLERACARALLAGARSYKNVDSILVRGLDQLPPAAAPAATSTAHENIRGPSYYD